MHCENLQADRQLGAYWEQQFCVLAARFGRFFSAHQLNRTGAACAGGPSAAYLLLPDITIWSAPGEHHEIKHKAPTPYGSYGLERYRFEALLWFAQITGQRVYYTIHDHSRTGGRNANVNRIEDWVTAEVRALAGQEKVARGPSWVDGKKKDVCICYWPTELFRPLGYHFALGAAPIRQATLGRAA